MRSLLFRLFDHFYQAPALGLAQRPAFHDPYHVADGALVLLIMGMEAGSLFYELTIDGVLYLSFDGDSDGLIHLIALHDADPCFTQISFDHFSCFFEPQAVRLSLYTY